LLQSRGMVIDDSQAAENFLREHNYYLLNIYFHKQMDTVNHFKKGIRFDNIIQIFEYDRWLRNQLLWLLEPIEVKLKTVITHHLAIKYGPDCFYKNTCFENQLVFNKVVCAFQEEIDRDKQSSVYRHHQSKYAGKFPIWVIATFLTFGDITNLYYSLFRSDKEEIARKNYGIDANHLNSWINSLRLLRNICAHYGYLYQRKLNRNPQSIGKEASIQALPGNLFIYCMAIKCLSNPKDWKTFYSNLLNTVPDTPYLSLKDFGFPEHWQDILAPN